MNTASKRLVIGVVGLGGGGKDTVCAYLAEYYGFTFVSTSDYIREHITRNGLGDLSAENLNRRSTELRRELGPDFPTRQILEAHVRTTQLVLGGLRVVAEGECVKSAGGIIISVDASVEVRYRHALRRARPGESKSFAEFVALDKKEAAGSDPTTHNVNALMASAELRIMNDGSLEDLYRKTDEIIALIAP
ncbi:MAG: AAA family ATPase [Patescibacteria group bacterium]